MALELTWEQMDFLSIHMYVSNHHEQDTPSYLGLAKRFEDFVDTMAATLRYVKAKTRSKHDIYLSWDEWQVWHPGQHAGKWEEAPHLAEVGYNLEDALVVAQWLNVFLRKSDVLKAACVAQVVNIISWLHTTRDSLLKHTSYWPFKWVSNNARGNALDVLVRSPQYENKQFGSTPLLDVSASHDPATGAAAMFIVNRSQSEIVTTDVLWEGAVPKDVKSAWQLAGDDPQAGNTHENPNNVVPKQLKNVKIEDGKMRLRLPPLSFTTITLA